MNELISVIIPCYNCASYVKKAISSIQNQTLKNIEIICIDDKSTDNTLFQLEELAKKDIRIRVIKNEQNLKLIATLNKGIDLATGKYIARMDADDISNPNRLELELNELHDKELDIVSSYFSYITHKGSFYGKSTQLYNCTSTYACRYMCLFFPPFLHPNVLVKTEVLRKYKYLLNPTTLHIEDFNLWSRMFEDNIRCYVIPKYLFLYRRNRSSVSHLYNNLQSKNHVLQSLANLKKFLGISFPNEIIEVITHRNQRISMQLIQQSLQTLTIIQHEYLERYPESDQFRINEITNYTNQKKFEILVHALRKNPLLLFYVLKTIITLRKEFFTGNILNFIIINSRCLKGRLLEIFE